MAEVRRGAEDPELVELFADDPTGLAIVDAIAASGDTARGAGRRRLVVLAAAVTAVAVAAALFASASSRAGVIDRALHAFSTKRVLHLALVDLATNDDIVNVSNGRPVAVRHVVSEWFDPKTGRGRVRDSLDGVTISDQPASRALSTGLPAAVTSFPLSYRRALEHARERDVSRRVIKGHPSYWLRFRTGPILAVAIDRRTFRPSLVIVRGRSRNHAFRVAAITELLTPHNTLVPQPAPHLPATRVLAVRSTNPPADVAVAVRDASGYEVASAQKYEFAGGATGYDLIFARAPVRGRLPQHFVRIQTAAIPRSGFGWTPSLVALTAPTRLVLARAGSYDVGYFRSGTSYSRISTRDGRRTLLAVAQRLAR